MNLPLRSIQVQKIAMELKGKEAAPICGNVLDETVVSIAILPCNLICYSKPIFDLVHF